MIDDWQIESSPATMEKLHDLIRRVQESERKGLHGRVEEMLDELPEGSAVAVSPPEFGDGRDGVVSVAYTLKPLMAGMTAPPGWTLYERPRPLLSPVIFGRLPWER